MKINTQRAEPEAGVLRHRAFSSVVKSIDQETLRIDFTISTEAVDRYGDIIRVKGWDLKPYKKNPVVLFGHMNREPPVAKAIRVWKDDTVLRATAEFMPADVSEFAFSIFRMYQLGFLRAVSVGFIPIKWDYIKDEEDEYITGYDYLKSELLEFSAVPVPANPEALVNARSKGINTVPFKKWAEDMLDDWEANEELIRSYGVDQKGLDLMRRKAAGTGKVHRLTATEQAELRRKNFGDIGGGITLNLNINPGGSKEEEPKDFLDDDEQQKDVNTMKVKQGILLVDADKVEELKTACKDAELHLIPLADKGKQKQFLAIPEIDSSMVDGAKGVQLSTEEVKDVTTLVIDKAPKKSLFDPETLTKDEYKAYSFNEKDGSVFLTIKASNGDAVYKLLGMENADAELLGELVKEAPKAPEKKDKPADKSKDDDAGDEDTEDKSKDKSKEKKLAFKESEGADDSDDEEKVELTPEVKETLKALLGIKSKSKDKAAEAPNLAKMAEELEGTLTKLEEGLEKAKKSAVNKAVTRKLEFLGGYMRELADLLDPKGKSTPATDEPDTEEKSEDDGEVEMEDLGTALAKALEGRLGPVIEQELKKLRGQLEDDVSGEEAED